LESLLLWRQLLRMLLVVLLVWRHLFRLMLVGRLCGRLLLRLGILEVLLLGGVVVLLGGGSPDGPRIDGGWHPGPRHGCRSAEEVG